MQACVLAVLAILARKRIECRLYELAERIGRRLPQLASTQQACILSKQECTVCSFIILAACYLSCSCQQLTRQKIGSIGSASCLCLWTWTRACSSLLDKCNCFSLWTWTHACLSLLDMCNCVSNIISCKGPCCACSLGMYIMQVRSYLCRQSSFKLDPLLEQPVIQSSFTACCFYLQSFFVIDYHRLNYVAILCSENVHGTQVALYPCFSAWTFYGRCTFFCVSVQHKLLSHMGTVGLFSRWISGAECAEQAALIRHINLFQKIIEIKQIEIKITHCRQWQPLMPNWCDRK